MYPLSSYPLSLKNDDNLLHLMLRSNFLGFSGRSSFSSRSSFLGFLGMIIAMLSILASLSQLHGQEKLSFTVESFSEAVLNHNLNLRINKLDPERLYESYINQKNQGYPSSLEVSASYSPFYTFSQLVGELRTTWQTRFISGTALSLGIYGQFTRANANNSTWIVGAPTITFSQSFLKNGFAWNQNRKALYPTLYSARASDDNFKHLITTTLFNALTTYHQFLINQELISLYEKDLKDVKAIFKFNKRKSRLGALLKSDLLSSEILTIEAERALETTRSTTQRLKNDLIIFLGKSPETNYKLVLTDSIALDKLDIDKRAVVTTAIESRSDYKALLTQLSSAKNSLHVNKLAKLPTLDLSLSATLLGTGDSLSASFTNIAPGITSNYNLNIGLNFSVRTDAKWYRSVTASSELEVTKLELQLQQLKENIETQIDNTLISLEENYNLFQKNRRILKLTQNRYAIVRKDYYDGLIDFATNANVKRELIRARTAYLNSKLAYEVNLLEFQYLTGQVHAVYHTDQLSHQKLLDEKIK